jgi:hypothetical protein
MAICKNILSLNVKELTYPTPEKNTGATHEGRSHDPVVGIAGRQMTKGSEFESCRVKNFLFSTSIRPVLGSTKLPIQWVPRALSPGDKAAEA